VLNKLDMVPAEERVAKVVNFVKRYGWKGPVYQISALTREGCEHLVQAIYQHVASMQEHHEEADIRFEADGDLIEAAQAPQVDLSDEVTAAEVKKPAAKKAPAKKAAAKKTATKKTAVKAEAAEEPVAKKAAASKTAVKAPAKKAAAKKVAAKKAAPAKRTKDEPFVPDVDDPRFR